MDHLGQPSYSDMPSMTDSVPVSATLIHEGVPADLFPQLDIFSTWKNREYTVDPAIHVGGQTYLAGMTVETHHPFNHGKKVTLHFSQGLRAFDLALLCYYSGRHSRNPIMGLGNRESLDVTWSQLNKALQKIIGRENPRLRRYIERFRSMLRLGGKSVADF